MISPSPDLILCSTARLARSLRASHGRARQQAGLAQWRPVQALTLVQWLEGAAQRALLSGDIPPLEIPARVLSGMAERLVWESVIAGSLKENALFDVPGMAQSALEANVLMQAWGVRFPDDMHTEETRQFLRWRAAFREQCRALDALEDTRMFDVYIQAVAFADLPPRIYFAGFDRISPQEQRLFESIRAQGVELLPWPLGLVQPAPAVQAVFDEAEAECRAAVAWAQARLQQNPQARLAIIAPELATLRAMLQALLDDALHPASIHPAQAELPRSYDFSLGLPLAETPLVATAIALLRLASNRGVTQQETGALLRDVYWSAGVEEADARARLEANMRRKLPASVSLEQLLGFARNAQEGGLGVGRLIAHLQALQHARVTTRQIASGWAQTFSQMLEAAHWPGERSLSSVEFQSRQAWNESLQAFAALDPLLGKMECARALRQFTRLLRERIFQPESIAGVQIQVMGMLEVSSEPLDGVWVLGMNDHLWPPPARFNPLLPAESQRRVGAPNSCSRVQAEFAGTVHARLLFSAPEVVFSWAQRDGERELRMSPLLKDIPVAAQGFAQAKTLAEQLAQPEAMQWLQDHQAPPVAEGEKVRGGAGLFRAQAICPAWGYYQYRLGAKALQTPVDGLDSMERGSLLHAVLQAFWNGRDSDWLHGLGENALQQAITTAVEEGVRQFSQALEVDLPPHFLTLEKLRLAALLQGWAALEKERPPFAVQDVERRVQLEIKGISVELTLDRVDILPDGQMVVIDYKTGTQLSPNSWAEDRISEPQLPIYAALVLVEGEVAAVCFAKVRAGEHQFVGIANDTETLPGVKGLEDARKIFDAERFPEWHALLQHWRDSLEAIADEIKAGQAAVRFTDENDLAYCEVKSLLRLPERKLQQERSGR